MVGITGGVLQERVGKIGGIIVMDDGSRTFAENVTLGMGFLAAIWTHKEISQEEVEAT